MPKIFYTVNGDKNMKFVERENPIENYEKNGMSLHFLAQDITEIEYENGDFRQNNEETHFDIEIWNSEQTEIIHKYIGFVRFKPYYTVRKTA